MLTKLIKYDFKSLNRFLTLMHIFMLLAAFSIRLIFTGSLNPQVKDSQFDFIIVLITVLCIFIITAIAFGTQLIIAARFYKNLFTDEGYLTRTLPVTSSKHLLSKTICGSVWLIADVAFIFLSLYIMMWTPPIKRALFEQKELLSKEFGLTGKYENLSFQTIFIIYFLFCILSAISNVILIYASVTLGQLFSSHRILGAVVAYFLLTTLLSILMLILMAAIYGNLFTFIIPASQETDSFNFIDYNFALLKTSAIAEIPFSVILYTSTFLILKKKFNLF